MHVCFPESTVTPDEREKLLGQALIEDFKARWQELLNFESENNRWSTIYVTAIIAVVGWFVNNPKPDDLGSIVKGANGYLLLLLAFINNLYTLSMAMKGYQIQQLGLYLYCEVRPKLNALTGEDSGTWERWRREQFQDSVGRGRPERLRSVYYVSISALPLFISSLILLVYYKWSMAPSFLAVSNLAFYASCVAVVVIGAAAISTTGINKRWDTFLAKEEDLRQEAARGAKYPAA
jgi:hypothetical protein